jgi:hypothetical protein
MKLQTDQENSNYFMRLGNTALSHWWGYPGGGGKIPQEHCQIEKQKRFFALVACDY